MTPEEDDFAEPEIPEYLLAERRRNNNAGGRGGRGQGGGGRGGVRSAYASAVERERYGRSAAPRYSEPVRQSQPPRRRDDRPVVRQPAPQQHRGGGMPRSTGRDSSEPWSEVPPELEELLRAQLSTKLSRPAGSEAISGRGSAPAEEAQPAETKAPARRGGRRKPEAEAVASVEAETGAPVEGGAAAEKPKPASRSRRKPAEASVEAGADTSGEGVEAAAPKKRAPARRRTAAAAEAAGEAIAEGSEPTGE